MSENPYSSPIKRKLDSQDPPTDFNEVPESDIPLWYAVVPIVVLVLLLSLNVYCYKDDATYGPNQIALIFSTIIAGLFGWKLKTPFEKMLRGINSSIGSALNAILILLMIGALAGTWLISGVVPAMVCYGLQVLSPGTFLFATVIVCALVSLITGSSWSTIATVGVAMLGIGNALGFHTGLTAGAIISGAYFGDKMSPPFGHHQPCGSDGGHGTVHAHSLHAVDDRPKYRDHAGDFPSDRTQRSSRGIDRGCRNLSAVSYTHLTLPTTPYV